MSIFDDTVPGNESRTPNLPDGEGTYTVQIETLRYNDGKTNPSRREGVVVEFKIAKSSREDVEAGDFYSTYFGLDGRQFPGHPELQRKELLTFIVASMGFNPDKASDHTAFRAAHKDVDSLFMSPKEILTRSVVIESSKKICGPKSKTPGKVVWILSFYPAAQDPVRVANEAMQGYLSRAPPSWERSPDGAYALNPATNAWHDVETGKPA